MSEDLDKLYDWDRLKDDSRCLCGGRYFMSKSFIVTCKDGRAFPVTWVSHIECCDCSARYLYPRFWPAEAGKKRLMPIVNDEGEWLVKTFSDPAEMKLSELLDKVADLEMASQEQDKPDKPACKIPYHKRGEDE